MTRIIFFTKSINSKMKKVMANIDDIEERELFDKIALKYAGKDLYPSSRVSRKLRLLQTVLRSKISEKSDILEIGCGAGYAAEYLSGKYMNYTGIDFSSELISFAGSVHKSQNTRFEVADLFEFTPKKKFDLVFMIGVLHHMQNIQEALNKCISFLKPGGMIVINEPRNSNPVVGLLRWIRKKSDDSYSNQQVELKESELIKTFRESGLTDISVFPQGFFSTPFAEVIIKPQFISIPFSSLFCFVDRFIEKYLKKIFGKLSWNIIVTGVNPK